MEQAHKCNSSCMKRASWWDTCESLWLSARDCLHRPGTSPLFRVHYLMSHGKGVLMPRFPFISSHPDCHSLPIQFHSSPLPLAYLCQNDMFKQFLMWLPLFIFFFFKSSSGASCFLCKPFRIEQKSHHVIYKVLPNQAQPTPGDSRYPSSQTLPSPLLSILLHLSLWLPTSACRVSPTLLKDPPQAANWGPNNQLFSLFLSILEELSVNLNKSLNTIIKQ